MTFHENCLLADNSHVISYLIFSKIRKDDAKFVVGCSRDWRYRDTRYGYNIEWLLCHGSRSTTLACISDLSLVYGVRGRVAILVQISLPSKKGG